jgi:thiol-disulfide isomerase/thioredoxin
MSRSSRNRLIGALVVALVVFVAIALAACSSSPRFRYVTVTGRLPGLLGTSLTGGAVTASTYAGRVVVVNFWNPYCSPCRQEQRILDKAWTSLRDRGVIFVGVHTWVGPTYPYPYRLPTARGYLREFSVRYPVLDDPNQDIRRRFGVEGFPTTLVADADGNLRFEVLGPLQPGELEELVEMASSPAPS